MRGETLIDAGSGTGEWSIAFGSAFDRILGFDSSIERVELANWFKVDYDLPFVNFEKGDIRKLPLPDDYADAVFCYSVVVSYLDISEVYRELWRVLKPGGICYMGILAIAYQYYLRDNLSKTDEKFKTQGERGIYNSLCQDALQPLAPLIRPNGLLHSFAQTWLENSGDPTELIAAISGDAYRPVSAAATIRTDLGDAYFGILRSDLREIILGSRTTFSYADKGRGYRPEELEIASAKAGFARFEWAPEGMLSIQSNGSVITAPAVDAPPIYSDHQGRMTVWEALTWK